MSKQVAESITPKEQEAVDSIAHVIGIYGVTIALARWCKDSGGLAFVKRCVESVDQEHV